MPQNSVWTLHILTLALSLSATSTQDNLCETCTCENTVPFVVDCSNQGMDTMLLDDEWPQDIAGIDAKFDHNNLVTIERFGSQPIVSLSFRHNKISDIATDAFTKLRFLTYLDLSNNAIDYRALQSHTLRGPDRIEQYQPMTLSVLLLGYNSIHSIDQDAFEHLKNLTELYLDHNPMTILDLQTTTCLSKLQKLEVLSLAYNGLSSLPNGFLHTFLHLRVLHLSGNQFLKVPDQLQETQSLRKLSLNDNPISELLWNSFLGLSRLQELNVSSMGRLTRIGPAAFESLESLQTLHCSYNHRLSYVDPEAFRSLVNHWTLTELHLRRNALKFLPPNLAPWDKLDVIDIQGNPWRCDCHLRWMSEKLMKMVASKNPELTLDVHCSEPLSLSGVSIMLLTVNLSLFRCDSSLIFRSNAGIGRISNDVPETEVALLAILIFGLIVTVLLLAGVLLFKVQKMRHKRKANFMNTIRYIRAGRDETDATEDEETVDIRINVNDDTGKV